MSDTPIPQQQGLSNEDLNKMKPVEQKYHEVGNYTINKQIGLAEQKEQLTNLFLKRLIDFDKERSKLSPTDKFANDSCLDRFAEQLAKDIKDIISGQSWNVTTNVHTDVITPGWDGKVEGNTINNIPNTNVNCE